VRRSSRLVAAAVLAVAATHAAAGNSAKRAQAFARLPDWTGLWETELSKSITNAAGRSEVFSLGNLGGHPPYNPEWEQKYQAALTDPVAAEKQANSFKGCGVGSPEYIRSFPNIMEAPMVFQVVVTPEETLFVMDHGEVRHIYTDGRQHPGKDDLWPTPLGDSVGRWKGQTLVVDTVARTAGPVSIFGTGEVSEQAHFSEKVRLIDKDTLEDELTIEDPVRFVRPWTMKVHYSRVRDIDRLIPYDCEADRNPVIDGKLTISPK
jgi:hypothetical protein